MVCCKNALYKNNNTVTKIASRRKIDSLIDHMVESLFRNTKKGVLVDSSGRKKLKIIVKRSTCKIY